MNRIAAFLSLCFVVIAALAQQNIAVKYNVTDHDTDRGTSNSYEMVLVSGPSHSLYYNTMSKYVDSCNSTPEGKAALREVQLKAWRVVHPDGSVSYDGRKLGLAPEKKRSLYVEKSRTDNTVTVYDRFGEDLCSYTEPIDEIVWTIMEDSTKNILGHECLKATTDYHGRKWNVWFTPEIPVQDGPWKLRGLPGIILSAEGVESFNIEASEVGVTSQSVPGVYSVSNYQKGNRRKLLADREHYINNLQSILAAQGIKLNADGSPADLPEYNRRLRAWETDY